MGVERTQGAGLVAGWSPVGACPVAERGPGNPIRLCNPHLTVTRRFGHIVPRRPGPRGVALVRSLIGPVTLLLALAVVAAGLYVAAVFLLVVVVGSTLRPSRFHAAGGDDGVRLAGSGRTRLRRPAGERPLRPLRVAGEGSALQSWPRETTALGWRAHASGRSAHGGVSGGGIVRGNGVVRGTGVRQPWGMGSGSAPRLPGSPLRSGRDGRDA